MKRGPWYARRKMKEDGKETIEDNTSTRMQQQSDRMEVERRKSISSAQGIRVRGIWGVELSVGAKPYDGHYIGECSGVVCY